MLEDFSPSSQRKPWNKPQSKWESMYVNKLELSPHPFGGHQTAVAAADCGALASGMRRSPCTPESCPSSFLVVVVRCRQCFLDMLSQCRTSTQQSKDSIATRTDSQTLSLTHTHTHSVPDAPHQACGAGLCTIQVPDRSVRLLRWARERTLFVAPGTHLLIASFLQLLLLLRLLTVARAAPSWCLADWSGASSEPTTHLDQRDAWYECSILTVNPIYPPLLSCSAPPVSVP